MSHLQKYVGLGLQLREKRVRKRWRLIDVITKSVCVCACVRAREEQGGSFSLYIFLINFFNEEQEVWRTKDWAWLSS